MNKVKLTQVAQVIRSKNAGPYELTLDILFRDEAVYREVKARRLITPALIAGLYGLAPEQVLSLIYFDPAWAVKITLVRPLPSGDLGETDVYGAQQHAPLLDLELPLGAASEGFVGTPPEGEEAMEGEELKRILPQLKTREREIVEKKWGLKDGRPWTLEELAQGLGADAREVREAETLALALWRLHEFRRGGKRTHEKGKLLLGLTPRESFIIRLLMGEEGGEPRTLEEIERRFSLSPARIRLLLEKAWKVLK